MGEEGVIVEGGILVRNPQDALHAAKIRHRLAGNLLAGHGIRPGERRKRRVVVRHLVPLRNADGLILIGPPVPLRPGGVVCRAGEVEGVGDLMGDDKADAGKELLVGVGAFVERLLEHAGEDVDRVVSRVVIAVHGARRHQPVAVIDLLVDKLCRGLPGEGKDRLVGLDQGAALFFADKVEGGEVRQAVRVVHPHGQGVQFLLGFRL